MDEPHDRSLQPLEEELRGLKENTQSLESEIREAYDDNGRLETELFATMEDRARIEDDLLGMRDQVHKLKNELFHLKIERENLDADLRKSKGADGTHDQHVSAEQLEFELAREARELSDVMEASHESMDSENSSQLSDGHESRDSFLKTCFANMSQAYTLMPSPENAGISEEEMSDERDEPTLSDANVDSESDEDIVITKLARHMQSARSPGNSPTKEKGRFDQSSPTKAAKKDIAGNKSPSKHAKGKEVPGTAKGKVGSPTEVRTQEDMIRDLKKRLHKAEHDVIQLREANEDLDEDLTLKKGQLAQAQKTIIDLEGQVIDEKDTCEQVRQLYVDIKERCEILESQATVLRTELERALREKAVFLAMSAEGQTKEKLAQKSFRVGPSKGSQKSSNAAKGIDLRCPPDHSSTTSELQMINLLEENAELKTKLDRTSLDKTRLEQQKEQAKVKADRMESALRFTEDQCRKLNDEVLALKRGKLQLGNDLSDLQNKNYDALEKCRETAVQLSNDLDKKEYINENLAKDNTLLQSAIAKMEGEMAQWKKDFELVFYECERLEGELIKSRHQNEQLKNQSTVKGSKQPAAGTEGQGGRSGGRENQEFTLDSKLVELKRLNSDLNSEITAMNEYQLALEERCSKVKSEADKWKAELAEATHRLGELERQLHEGEKGSVQGDNKAPLGDKERIGGQSKEAAKAQHHMFYSLTGEISESESLGTETARGEEDLQLLKLENTYLLQQISDHEQTLKSQMDELKAAKEKLSTLGKELEVAQEQLGIKTKSEGASVQENNGKITLKGRCEFLQRKNSELLAENSKLQTQCQVASEQMDKIVAENEFMKAESASLREMMQMQKEKKAARASHGTQKTAEISSDPPEKDARMSEPRPQAVDTQSLSDGYEKSQLEDDLLRVTGDKLRLEFELVNANSDIEKMRVDLDQAQSEKVLLSSQMNENLQKVANLEINLMEMRCTNESMKGEFAHLREEKRQESYYRQEASIFKETMEKRLEETLMSKQRLRQELDDSIGKTQDALERIQRLEKQNQEGEKEAEKLRQQSQELQEELNNTMTRIEELEERAKQLQKEKHEIEEKIKLLRRQNFELKQALQSRERQNKNAKEKVNGLEKRVKSMKLELERLQQRNSTLRKEFEAKETRRRNKATQCKLQDENGENTRLKTELCRLQEEKEQLKVYAAAKKATDQTENGDLGAQMTHEERSEGVEENDANKCTTEGTDGSAENEENASKHEDNLPDMDDAVSAMVIMSKEKLLLESTAIRFSRVQMRLEQSLSKALAQNESLKIKISENDAAMRVLRARVHELETGHENAAKWKELKRQVTISSDSDSDDEQGLDSADISDARSDLAVGQIQKTDAGGLAAPVKGLGAIMEADEDSSPGQLDAQRTRENEQAEVGDGFGSHVSKVEDAASFETEPKDSGVDTGLSEDVNGQSEDQSEIADDVDEGTSHVMLAALNEESRTSQSDVSSLMKEKEALLGELEEIRGKYNVDQNEMQRKATACKSMEDELKLRMASYERENESLVKSLENAREETKAAEEKLRELKDFQATLDEVRSRRDNAENMVEELEKNMLLQTDIRKGLEKQLFTCQGRLEEMDSIQEQMSSISRENKEMMAVNGKLKDEISQAKNENETLQKMLETHQAEVESLKEQLDGSPDPEETSPHDKPVRAQQNGGSPPVSKSESIAGKVIHQDSAVSRMEVDVPYVEMSNQNGTSSGEATVVATPRWNGGGGGEGGEEKRLGDVSLENDETAAENPHKKHEVKQGSSIKDLGIEGGIDEHKGEQLTEGNPGGRENNLVIRNSDADPTNGVENPTAVVPGTEDREGCDQGAFGADIEDRQTGSWAENGNNGTVAAGEEPRSTEVQDGDGPAEVAAGAAAARSVETHQGRAGDETNETAASTSEECGDERAGRASTEERQLLLLEKEENLRRERVALEERIENLIQENEALTVKIDTLQTQGEPGMGDTVINSDQTGEVQSKLDECLEAKQRVEEENRDLQKENAKLEVELSDAIECREALERELVYLRERGAEQRYELEEQLREISEKYSEIEAALSHVLQENSKVETNLAFLQQENQMLKNYKIMEITDSYTQFSPRTTEDESEGEGRQRRRLVNGKLANSRAAERKPTSPQSQTWPSVEAYADESYTSSTAKSSEDSSGSNITPPESQDFQMSDIGGWQAASRLEKHCPDPAGGRGTPPHGRDAGLAGDESDEGSTREGADTPTMPEASSDDSWDQPTHVESYKGEPTSLKYRDERESDEYESSVEEVETNDSLVSITDLDLSSDLMSSEDGLSMAANKQGYKRLQRDLAETKCSNTLLTNELSILKRHNRELQNQVQKYVNRNNQLKQKVCDRTMALRRTEKGVAATKEDYQSLLAKATAAEEEFLRVEKEKAKLERNLAATKGDNKRLKSDLSSLRAELYRTMKEVVALQTENRKLHVDLKRQDAKKASGSFRVGAPSATGTMATCSDVLADVNPSSQGAPGHPRGVHRLDLDQVSTYFNPFTPKFKKYILPTF